MSFFRKMFSGFGEMMVGLISLAMVWVALLMANHFLGPTEHFMNFLRSLG